MNQVKVGFFSLTAPSPAGDDDAYLRWHLLDHQPEQYSIPGIRLATRWRADDGCVAARWVAVPPLDDVRHAVAYLMTAPIDETLAEFAELGRRTAESGRLPARAAPLLVGGFHHLATHAAPRVLVGADAVPFRPHRGVVLLVEQVGTGDVDGWARWLHAEHVPALLRSDGVAGVSTFRSSSLVGIGAEQARRYSMPIWDPGDRLVTVIYVDDDLVSTTGALEGEVRSRWEGGVVTPELAGPFRSMVAYEVWPEG